MLGHISAVGVPACRVTAALTSGVQLDLHYSVVRGVAVHVGRAIGSPGSTLARSAALAGSTTVSVELTRLERAQSVFHQAGPSGVHLQFVLGLGVGLYEAFAPATPEPWPAQAAETASD